MTDPRAMLLEHVENHQMRTLREDGLYRHIRFREPGTSIWGFDLITWPGHLVITGDIDDFHFARVADMFEFFRRPVGEINPTYWTQKLRGPTRTKSYSPSKLRSEVYAAFRDAQDWFPGPHRPLWQRICDEVLSEDHVYSEELARQALSEFRYYHADDVEPAGPARDFVPQRIPKRWGRVFEFTDSWEWDLTEFDYHYLLSLHAIVWGVAQYDKAKQVAA